MEKIKIGAKTFLYPMPLVLVGANVGGRVNYLTVAYCGIVHHLPAMISIALGKSHYTNAGIKDTKTFSVNIPSEDMVQITDYCGIYSGKKLDKSNLFETFYGTLETAPMIKECPLNLECKVVEILDYNGTNEIFIGEIIETYTEDKYLTQGLPDIEKLRPVVFSMHDNNYWKVGDHLGRAWKIGKNYSPSQ
jgi:flavin reductase (DIM6/NTAB) family NADH-FMN oxidoreductase RutF